MGLIACDRIVTLNGFVHYLYGGLCDGEVALVGRIHYTQNFGWVLFLGQFTHWILLISEKNIRP